MILFVASNPSRLNIDPNIAIIGSKSEKTFNSWAEYLSPQKDYQVTNVSDKITDQNKPLKRSEYNLTRLSELAHYPTTTKVVALGKTAADALDQIGIKYYKLPHPSPLNRFLNNTVQVEAVLEDCKAWLDKSL
jgi:uracil-DNA glycosylase